MTKWWIGLLVWVPCGSGCNGVLPPLGGEIDVGHDAYGVFVGGSDRGSDLYVFDPSRNAVRPLTYTAVAELAPTLSPDGAQVALLRAGTLQDSLPGTAWVLDLRTGSERELVLPDDAGAPRRIGWARGGAAVFVVGDRDVYRFDLSQKRKPQIVRGAERAAADSSFAVLLGSPAFARVVPCEDGHALCIAGDTGAPELLARGAHDPVRWGRDSVGYFIGDVLEVRPLGPGRLRQVRWNNPPPHPRAMTYFPGRPTTETPR
jgi:hypothetical protein